MPKLIDFNSITKTKTPLYKLKTIFNKLLPTLEEDTLRNRKN